MNDDFSPVPPAAPQRAGDSRAVRWREELLDLRHPNYYVAFLKSTFWGTIVYLALAVTAVITTAAVSFLFKVFLPQGNKTLFLLVDTLGLAGTLITFLAYISVLVTETFTLISKVRAS